jgi:hypothetical protein
MAFKAPMMRATINNAPKTISNNDKQSLTNTHNAQLEKSKIEKRQEDIDTYNFDTCNQIDPYFDTIQLAGNDIIVRLHKENYIKGVYGIDNNEVMYNAYISQVDYRMKATDKPNWCDNPLPYVLSGVVVAISPAVEADQLKRFNEVGDKYRMLKVGDIVNLTHFQFQDNRFYKNKQEIDFIKNPEEYRIEHWEGYIKIHSTYVESIVLNKDSFKVTSPYRLYKESLNNN